MSLVPKSDKIKIAVIGSGVIGAGWVARFLLNGYDVSVFDPNPQSYQRLERVIEQARRSLTKLYDTPLPVRGSLTLSKSLGDAVEGAGWIQENVPERLEAKLATYREIEAHIAHDAIIASSTSGYKPSELRAGAMHPSRIIVAHPFNPVYLLPLVELVGLASDPAEAFRTKVTGIVTSLGMYPLVIAKEIDAHIADRFLEAVWREALWLVRDGIATTEDIDEAIRMGFGLRWAQMGLFETYRIAGGDAGMRHFLHQFGPCLTLPWTKLMEVPPYDEALVDLIAGQSDAQSGHHSIAELEAIRDRNLVGFMRVLKPYRWGAGAIAKDYEERRLQELQTIETTTPALSLASLSKELWVKPDWIDYNGHMTESRYLFCGSEVCDQLLAAIGGGPAYAKRGYSHYTAESHICHRDEAKLGEMIEGICQILGYDEKRIHIFITLKVGDRLVATVEQMLLHVDMKQGKTVASPPAMLDKLATLAKLQQDWPIPEAAGRRISMPLAK